MVFLVPHSSHLTQPLDLCVFALVKNTVRNEATYLMKLEGDDGDEAEEGEEGAMEEGDTDGVQNQEAEEESEEEEEEEHPRQRAERGKALADYIVALLDAYERATTRRRVVSAFGQAGIFYKTPNPNQPQKRVA